MRMDSRLRPNLKGKWQKNWVGNWGMVFCSWYGDIYTNTFGRDLGKRLETTILHYNSKTAINFIHANELGEICAYFADKIKEDEGAANLWCRQLRERTDKIMGLMDAFEGKGDFTLKDYRALSSAVHLHIPPNFAIKKVIDYLPQNLLRRHLHDFQEARLYCEPVYNRVESTLRELLGVIGKREGVDVNLLHCLLDFEMEKYLLDGELPALKILKERPKGSLLWYKNGKLRLFTGKEARTIMEEITRPQSADFASGAVAFKGKAKGIARIVLDPRKCDKFEKGDILITGMTRPEFLPLMRKAAGFVTDAGGMLCHAAIVARELRKPCTVGTEIATKIFRNGDLVEIDAFNGVVKKARE